MELKEVQNKLLRQLEEAAYIYYTDAVDTRYNLGYLTSMNDACILAGIGSEVVLRTKISGQRRAGAD